MLRLAAVQGWVRLMARPLDEDRRFILFTWGIVLVLCVEFWLAVASAIEQQLY